MAIISDKAIKDLIGPEFQISDERKFARTSVMAYL